MVSVVCRRQRQIITCGPACRKRRRRARRALMRAAPADLHWTAHAPLVPGGHRPRNRPARTPRGSRRARPRARVDGATTDPALHMPSTPAISFFLYPSHLRERGLAALMRSFSTPSIHLIRRPYSTTFGTRKKCPSLAGAFLTI